MGREELRDWLRIHLAAGVGPKRFRLLMDAFGSPRQIVRASRDRLTGVPGLGRALSRQIYEGLQAVDPDAELETARSAGVTIITLNAPEYPELLKNCPDPPPVLYVKGRLESRDKLSLAVVGTRRPGTYGSEQTNRFSFLLAQAGFTIVSGLARGVDAQAHRGVLLAKGRTIGVLGSGLGMIYPPEHAELADQMVKAGGAVISEFPMATAPQPGNFPARNRIVAGMTLGTLVVEAPVRSGALITASLAGDYNREVYAIPGPIDRPSFTGCHELIKKGKAKLICSIEDILDELGPIGETLKPAADSDTPVPSPDESLGDLLTASLSDQEKTIWTFLAHGANDIDTICALCQLPAHHASAALTTLQLKGLIKPMPGNQFARR